jgi:putative alpha-1,2-mannosidase
VLDFETKPHEQVEARVGVSGVSIAGAANNLSETKDKTFDAVKMAADKVWNSYLGKIKVTGTDKQKITFYTSLYHTLIQPNNIADIDGKYRGR